MLLWCERQRKKTRRLHFCRITINQMDFSRPRGSCSVKSLKSASFMICVPHKNDYDGEYLIFGSNLNENPSGIKRNCL